MRRAVQSAKPDAIVHEMTDLKGVSDLRHFDRGFATSNRLRTEGTDHLLAAAREAGVQRFVAQSFCGWSFARVGGPVRSEEDPLDPEPPQELRRTLEAIRYLEKVVTEAREAGGIVLRYGAFYGPDTGLFDGSFIGQIVRRRVPVIGDGNGWWSFVHIDDAATATALAIERGEAGNIYNIVDDEPAPVREWLPALSATAWRQAAAACAGLAGAACRRRASRRHDDAGAGGSNAKAKRELGWQPAHPSWRQGFAEVLRQRRAAAH